MLDRIIDVLESDIKDNEVIIEGHTDNIPIQHSRWSSNWELSTARALSVLHYFTEEGELAPQRFTVSGYGDQRPVADNSTELGRQRNRRVEIIILPTKIIKIRQSGTSFLGHDSPSQP